MRDRHARPAPPGPALTPDAPSVTSRLMATVLPFKGTRFNPEHVKLGGVLAPPYDVITAAQRDELYGRDLRNIVRIDYGITFPETSRVSTTSTRAQRRF